ncbi:MAG: DUF11 domain-containing protein, partial [Clostridia bacterium]|nr:DUF11 domain-containing protein [Clostridia bacterium]
AQHPAAYYYLDPSPDPNPTSAAFRMRLNGSPLSNNPNVYELKEFVWGVEIRSAENAVLFTVLVNASGNNYFLQVRDYSSTLIYDVPIVLSSPVQPADNVRVVDAGANFPCGNPMIPDEDYFLDFTLPTTPFLPFNFESSTYRLCYFTSTQDNVINKDNVCGPILNPPIDEPSLCVTKKIVSGPKSLCADEINSWSLQITVYNCGTVPVDNISVTDELNSLIILASEPVFIPNVNVSYDSVLRVVTWSVGTLALGERVALTITLTGHFAAPGHYILDSGTVTATDLTPVDFADSGILVYAQGQLKAVKEIVSGPFSIGKCRISTWTLSITVTNTGEVDIPNLVVTDLLSGCFTLEAEPELVPSAGYASFSDGEIVWTIDVLEGDSSETLQITVEGFFSCEGHIVFDTGSFIDQCMQTVTFQDPGVEVLPVPIAGTIRVCGCIRDCRTNEPLGGVTAAVYDSSCNIAEAHIFDWGYCLELPAGTYTVLFEKEGYAAKFLALLLHSDMDIEADVNMAPMAAPRVRSGCGCCDEVDLFSYIVCEKIDADLVYSSFVCVNSRASVESLDDIVDSAACAIVCNSKLRLVLDLEKNLVYKLDGTKDFQYFNRTLPVCFPLRRGGECNDFKYYLKVNRVSHCKDGNIVYNTARLRFKAYLLCEDDVMV